MRVKDTTLLGNAVAKILVSLQAPSQSDPPQVGYVFVEMSARGWLLWAYIGETADAFRKSSAYWIDSVSVEPFPAGQHILDFPLDKGAGWNTAFGPKNVVDTQTVVVPAGAYLTVMLSCPSTDNQLPTMTQWYSDKGLVRQTLNYPDSPAEGGRLARWKSLALLRIDAN